MTITTRRTFCRVCHAACPLDVDVDVAEDRVIAVRGVADDPLFEGYTCSKGRQLSQQLSHPERLRTPLLRSGASFAEVSGRALFDHVAERIGEIVREHGPRAVATYVGTGAYQSSCAVPVAHAWHEGLGSPSFYTSMTIDQPAKATAPARIGIWEAGYHGFASADVVMAIGYNPMVSSYGPTGGIQGTNPFTTLRRAKRDGLAVIVVDPRRTELAAFADVFLQIRPGEDPTLLAGMMRIILVEDRHDRAFCDAWISDLADLERAVEPFTPAYVSARCGIEVDDLVRAAHLFATGPRGTAGTGTGPNMSPHSSLTEHLTMALNIICGRVNGAGDELDGSFLLSPAGRRRAQVLPRAEPTPGPPARVRGLRGFHREMPTATLADEILTPGPGRIRALIVSGGNPVVAWPDQELAVRALRDLELLVVVDPHMTATAELAHAVVPPRLSLERADVPHLMDRWFAVPYTNYTPAVVAPVGDTYAEWEVFWELAMRLGTAIRLPGGEMPLDRRPDDDDVLDLVYRGSRLPVAEMRRHRGVVHRDLALVAEAADPDATARFTVAPDDLIGELGAVGAETDGADLPFRLVSRRLKKALNSSGAGATGHAHLHPDDLADLDVASGELVEICSRRGSIVALAATASDVRRGVVSIAHGWGSASLDTGSPTNRLVSTVDQFDPVTGMAVQSAIPVRIAKAGPQPTRGGH